MGLTKNSTGSNVSDQDIAKVSVDCDYTVAITGNPNVRQKYCI